MNRISAKVVADSIMGRGHRITTMEIVFPRFILAEFNTHRLFSRNSASSRAIPFKKMAKSVDEQPFIPIAWQIDHTGMQGSEYITDPHDIEYAIGTWLHARDAALEEAKILHGGAGVTKQLANRMLEPYMYHKVLITATEFDNFFELRCPQYEYRHSGNEGRTPHLRYFKSRREWLEYNDFVGQTEGGDNIGHEPKSDLEWLQINKGMGEIHIMDLAEKMYDAINESLPKSLNPGEWHIPYGDNMEGGDAYQHFFENSHEIIVNAEGHDKAWDNFKCQISVARCARLSYQTLGDNPVIDYKKDFELFKVLKDSGHFSPFEHVARVMDDEEYYSSVKGLANEYVQGRPLFNDDSFGWNNNFRGYMQYRWLLENNKL